MTVYSLNTSVLFSTTSFPIFVPLFKNIFNNLSDQSLSKGDVWYSFRLPVCPRLHEDCRRKKSQSSWSVRDIRWNLSLKTLIKSLLKSLGFISISGERWLGAWFPNTKPCGDGQERKDKTIENVTTWNTEAKIGLSQPRKKKRRAFELWVSNIWRQLAWCWNSTLAQTERG